MTTKPRGGTRPGAGAPRLVPGQTTESVQVRLDPARKAKALAIGDGNVAKGVRAALDAFQNAGFPEATVDDSKAGALRAALEEAVAVLHSAGCDVTADACRRALTKQT